METTATAGFSNMTVTAEAETESVLAAAMTYTMYKIGNVFFFCNFYNVSKSYITLYPCSALGNVF